MAGAGIYRVDSRSGAMHGHRYLIHTLHYGSDGQHLFPAAGFRGAGCCRSCGHGGAFQHPAGRRHIGQKLIDGGVSERGREGSRGGLGGCGSGRAPIEAAFRRVLEVRISLRHWGGAGDSLRFQLSLWKDGLPWTRCRTGVAGVLTTEPSEWPI